MKVAVLSELHQIGQNSFSILLANTFSRTQRRNSAIFSTESTKEIFDIAEPAVVGSAVKSTSVFNALVGTAMIEDKEMFDYAYRLGEEECYVFDIYGSSLRQVDQDELFQKAVKRVPAELVLINITGSTRNPEVLSLLNAVDAILYCFAPNSKSMKMVKDYKERVDANIVRRTAFVCLRHDVNAISEKKVAATIGADMRQTLFFPYNANIVKFGIDHNLQALARSIAKGDTNTLNLRIKLLEVMQYLYDSNNVKYIKGVDEWYK